MKYTPLIIAFFLCSAMNGSGQATPDKIYGELFHDVQMARVFPDRKTFVDMVPKQKPAAISANGLI